MDPLESGQQQPEPAPRHASPGEALPRATAPIADRESPLAKRGMRAVELCRGGNWKDGHDELVQVAEALGTGQRLPSVFYSYLGYTIAWRQGRWAEGLEMCRRAVALEIFEPDNQVNLARVHLLRQQRAPAVDCLRRAIQLDGGHAEAHKLWERIGRRRAPVVSWLPRDNPVNRLLGRIRHDLRS